jgi:hypothetical protein
LFAEAIRHSFLDESDWLAVGFAFGPVDGMIEMDHRIKQ